jgi:hypothetical protein
VGGDGKKSDAEPVRDTDWRLGDLHRLCERNCPDGVEIVCGTTPNGATAASIRCKLWVSPELCRQQRLRSGRRQKTPDFPASCRAYGQTSVVAHEYRHACDASPFDGVHPLPPLDVCKAEESGFTFGATCAREAVMSYCAGSADFECKQECVLYFDELMPAVVTASMCDGGRRNLTCSDVVITRCQELLQKVSTADSAFQSCVQSATALDASRAKAFCQDACSRFEQFYLPNAR